MSGYRTVMDVKKHIELRASGRADELCQQCGPGRPGWGWEIDQERASERKLQGYSANDGPPVKGICKACRGTGMDNFYLSEGFLPCPRCEGDDLYLKQGQNEQWRIACRQCSPGPWGYDQNDALNRWNAKIWRVRE